MAARPKSNDINLPNNWHPRRYQWRLWDYLEKGGKRAVAVWHRRAGKDDVALHWTAVAALQRRVGNYWHMLPEAAQGRKAIWEAMNPRTGCRRINEAFPKRLRASTRDTDMRIEFRNGSTWQVVGSDNYDSLVGSAPVGIVFSEWALADPAAWAYLRPILAENNGWALFIYTARGRNHGYTLFRAAESDPEWFAQRLSVDETKAVRADIVAREEREYAVLHGAEEGAALFAQEYRCSFDAAILGAYYGAEIAALEREGRIRDVAWDPSIPVHTAWDLGFTDDTAIWFWQVAGGEVHLIDYYAASGKSIDHYCAVLKGKPYAYGRHWVPHDAQAKMLVSGGKSVIELARAHDVRLSLVRRNSLQAGIQAARALLPRCWFDATRCVAGLEALRQYRRAWDDTRTCFTDHPVHDWTSHPADAFRYLAWVWREPALSYAPVPDRSLELRGGPDGVIRSNLTINEIIAGLERKRREREGWT